MIESRLKEIESKSLEKGSHKSLDDGGCIMEMVSYVAGEPWSDHPKCACPILTDYAIAFNDRFNDDHRQKLKPLIPKLINTKATDKVQIARKRLIRWRNVTVTYPLILETFNLPKIAEELRRFENTLESMAQAREFLSAKRHEILAASPSAADYTYAYAYAYAYTVAYTDAYTVAYTSDYASAYIYAADYVYAYASASVYAYADADADAHANAHANASAYASAYANADTYPNADPYAFREKIAETAIETLRMAIEIGSQN